MNGNSKLGQDSDDIGGLGGLPGLKAVRDQLAERITVLQAEQARRNAGAEIRRPRGRTWYSPAAPVPANPGRQQPLPGGTGTWDCYHWGTQLRWPPQT